MDDFYRSILLHVEPEPLHASVLARLEEITGCSRHALFLLDARRGDLRCYAHLGAWPPSLLASRWRTGQGLARWLSVNETPLRRDRHAPVLEDLPPREVGILTEAAVALVAPLVAAGRLTGFIAMGEPAGRPEWSDEGVSRVATLAVPAALAFEHAALVREEERRLRHLYRAERLATAGTIAAGLAHEIRNPLTAVRSGVQILAGRGDMPADAAELLGDVIQEVDRIDRLVESLLIFARAPRSGLRPVDLADIVRRTASLLASRAREQGTLLDVDLPNCPVVVAGDPGELEQVALNLAINALDAAGTQGRVTLALATTGADDAPAAVLSVHDTGPGMSPADAERAFDPFFTTKPEGSGLGLPISFAIVRRHDGDLTLENGAEGGAVARIVLPLSPEAPCG